jgi:hypothetical protein
MEMAENERVTGSSPVSIAIAWLVVVLPAAWGVYNTILRAARLFH